MDKMVTVLLAHPDMSASVANKALLQGIENIDNIRIIRLYDNPGQKFDVEFYSNLIQHSSMLVFQFPLYWGGAPSELKRWIDEVFTAVIEKPVAIGKPLLVVTTAGASAHTFRSGGSNRFTIDELLRPFQAMTFFSGMVWQSPLSVCGQSEVEAQESLKIGIEEYRHLLLTHLKNT